METSELAEMAKKYSDKMRANYESGDNLKITPENVYQEGVKHNYDLFMELMEKLMLPGSGVMDVENLLKARQILDQKKSVLFLMKHAGNFDVSSFYSLVGRKGPPYTDILDRLVFIAGRKLNEDSVMVKTFTEVFNRIVIVPNREIPVKRDGETPSEASAREEEIKEAGRINRAALREMMRLKKNGHIIALFPMGGRPKPQIKEKGVKETTSYMRLFDYVYFIAMQGNLLPVGEKMMEESPRQDRIVFRVSEPVLTANYLDESRRRFEMQDKEPDFDQFNVDRVMVEIGQTEAVSGNHQIQG